LPLFSNGFCSGTYNTLISHEVDFSTIIAKNIVWLTNLMTADMPSPRETPAHLMGMIWESLSPFRQEEIVLYVLDSFHGGCHAVRVVVEPGS